MTDIRVVELSVMCIESVNKSELFFTRTKEFPAAQQKLVHLQTEDTEFYSLLRSSGIFNSPIHSIIIFSLITFGKN